MRETDSKAERTRRFIIEQTSEVFNKKGYAGTSIADLTEATGLTKGSIYGNFENKEEVAVAVFDYNCDRVFRSAKELIDKADTYHAKLMVYATIYRRVISEKLNRGGCPILNTATESDDTNPKLKAKAATAINKWVGNLTMLIERGIAAEEFKPDVDVNRTALAIVALIEGGVMIARVTDHPGHMEQVLQTVELLIRQMEYTKPH